MFNVDDILKKINVACRFRELSEQEKNGFGYISHVQRYHPGLDNFEIDDYGIFQNAELPTKYYISKWLAPVSKNIFNGIRETCNSSDETKEDVKVYVKNVSIIDPYLYLKNKYKTQEHSYIPQRPNDIMRTVYKVHDINNRAYVDATCSYLMSTLRELNITPHTVLSYGSITGISKKYEYDITDEYTSIYKSPWFWSSIHNLGAKIIIKKDDIPVETIPGYEYLWDTFFTNNLSSSKGCEEGVLDLSDIESAELHNIDTCSLHTYVFDEAESDNFEADISDVAEDSDKTESTTDTESTENTANESDNSATSSSSEESANSSSEDETTDDETDESINTEDKEYDLYELNLSVIVEIPDIPVVCVAQEAHNNTMNSLVDMEEIGGIKKNTHKWEKMWTAWLWQIIATLSLIQRLFKFTHNDLHTNNIVWRDTTEKYLYYTNKNGRLWRVPTYGKIFSIIDFGRSIFCFNNKLFISDDHYPENEAGGQYNFGPIYDCDEKMDEVMPNPSFDLCRLAVSLLDGLWETTPSKKNSTKCKKLSKSDKWIMWETTSQLYNLVWKWTVDDNEETVFCNEDGSDKIEGFDLYCHISKYCHNAVPYEQLELPIFTQFVFHKKVPENTTIYWVGH
jgi:hypothetical protein